MLTIFVFGGGSFSTLVQETVKKGKRREMIRNDDFKIQLTVF